MKTLASIEPTAEQLSLVSNPQTGVQIIRGAAGSGKTSTALLMLRQYGRFWKQQKERQGASGKVKVLVLTYNTTLKSYIQQLVSEQVRHQDHLDLTISTFAKWAIDTLGRMNIDARQIKSRIDTLSKGMNLKGDFIRDEVDYLTGRFKSGALDEYISCTRVGRGRSPQIGRPLRQRLLDEILNPLTQWKNQIGIHDWNDLAVAMQDHRVTEPYEVIIVDEMQDMSANQMRAIMNFAADQSSVILVIDAGQRIYPMAFSWTEVDIERPRSHRLHTNYRNTRQICEFVLPLLNDLELGDDGTYPELDSCSTDGPAPLLLNGLYSKQVEHAIRHIKSSVDLSTESVAFLGYSPKWFGYLISTLKDNSIAFADLTRNSEWPSGPQNVALSTMHSVKGLEFDHVYILGLNQEITRYENEVGDTGFENWRRLLAMAISRAKISITLGFKPGEASGLISLLDPDTYEEIDI